MDKGTSLRSCSLSKQPSSDVHPYSHNHSLGILMGRLGFLTKNGDLVQLGAGMGVRDVREARESSARLRNG
jgi:hypothetical protein